MISEQLQMNGLENLESIPPKLPSYPQGSRVNLTALREKVKAIVTTVTCGAKLQECSEKLDRVGSSAKIRPVCFQERINGISEGSFPILPQWGTAWVGEYGELVTWERRTNETECFLWRTPTTCIETFPTPLSTDAVRVRYSEETLRMVGERRIRKEYTKAGINLTEYVAVFPTPQATSWETTGARKKLKRLQLSGKITEQERMQMQAGNGGKLNPTWVEWLMGFPLGWTGLDASETQ